MTYKAMFSKEGVDQGYQDDPMWWYKGPNAFRIANLNEEYPEVYFPLAEPSKEHVDAIVTNVTHYFEKLSGRMLNEVLDYGCGGGWIAEGFKNAGVYIEGVDGSIHAVKAARIRVPAASFYVVDFRRPMLSLPRFHVVICTEVAEHIPPPFASVLVKSLCDVSDMVWFSSEPPGTNRPHLHHVNEQPIEYWQAIFKFYGYRCIMLPDEIHTATGERGRCIFVNEKVYPEQ